CVGARAGSQLGSRFMGLVRTVDSFALAPLRRRYHHEMRQPPARRLVTLLAALSHETNFSIGCYCEDATHCHRSLLRALLAAADADIIDPGTTAASAR
ncbi:MAG: DUF488 domain-containing protein, partial [Gemmatimonadota bacterium]|nr:DUF488 domain-containing protein [Gemmatimonadota bacterium]